jgi:hypothetical protein
MSLVKVQGNASGTGIFTIASPNSNTDRTLNLPDSSGTVATAESTLAQFNASGSAPVYAARAWVNFNGTGTVAIRASGNVSSITDNGTGDYTVNFTTAMPDANFASQGFAWASNKNAAAIFLGQPVTTTNPQTASSVRVATRDNISETILFDATVVNVSVFR